VRLQRQLNRRAKGKEYSKWLVVIPPDMVEKLGWREGEELELDVRGDELRLQRVRQAKQGGR